MPTIAYENIIIEWLTKTDKIRSDLKEVDAIVEDFNKTVKDAGKNLETALKGRVVEKMTKLIQATNKELKNTDALLAGVEEGFNEAMSTVPPENYIAALEELEATFDKALANLDQFGVKNESVLARAQRAFQAVVGFVAGGVRSAGAGFNKLLNAAATGVQRFGRNIFRQFQRLGGLAAALGIADLIAGWSTFSKQVQATLGRFPALQSGANALTRQFRQLGELFARTLAPVLQRIVTFLTQGLQRTNLGGVERAFKAVATLISNIAKGIASAFGAGGAAEQGFDNFVNGFTKAIAIANGVWAAFIDFIKSIRPFFLDAGSAIVAIWSQVNRAIGRTDAADRALLKAAQLKSAAQESLKDVEGFVNAFNRGYKEITSIPPTKTKWSDIVPTPTKEETAAMEKELERQRKLLQDWLNSLLELQQQFPVGGADSIVNQFQNVNERFRDLIAEAQKLGKEGILDPGQVQSSIALLQQLRDRAIEPLRKEFEAFTKLPPLKISTLEAVKDVKALDDTIKNLNSAMDLFRINLRLSEEEAARRIERIKQVFQDLSDAISALERGITPVIEAVKAGVQNQIGQFDRLVQAQENRVTRALVLAEEGNAELLRIEEERLNRTLQAREAAIQREQALARTQIAIAQSVAIAQGIAAVIRSALEKNIVLAIGEGVALAGAIAALIISLSSSFGSIPGFKHGTPYLDGPGTETSDSIVIRASRGERWFSAKDNKAIGGRAVSNAAAVEQIKIGQAVMSGAGAATVSGYADVSEMTAALLNLDSGINKNFNELLDEVAGMKQAIQELQIVFSVSEDGIEAAVTRTRRRQQRRKKIV